MGTTLRAMRRVSEIKDKRQDLFFRMRMRAHAGTQKEEIRAKIKKGIDIIAPAAADREKAVAIATSKLTLRQKVQQKMKN